MTLHLAPTSLICGALLALVAACNRNPSVSGSRTAPTTVSRSAVPTDAATADRCDCNASFCATETSPGRITGTLVRGQGEDANGQVERYIAIETTRPVCAELADMEHADRRHTRSTSRLQLVIADDALRGTLSGQVGQTVTLEATVFEAITAHHHTDLLLTVEPARGAAPDARPPQ
jgi:hypothetical protein